MTKKKKFEKGKGFNFSEQYLTSLCEKTFLSLWSYPNVFKQPGKELCDLLVVFGNEILIFSDKNCAFSLTGDLEINWNRWFKKAVAQSAKQLWGAEKWILEQTTRIFLDSKCDQSIPFPININDETNIHLILVAHGATVACQKILGGSGSMMYCTDVSGINNHLQPFMIGDIEKHKTFIHVLDDTTLDILLKERDTISDFTNYIKKRAYFLRSGLHVFSTGEEEMLARYLKDLNETTGTHDFVIPKSESQVGGILYTEGEWKALQKDPYWISKKKADKISYIWDGIIEKFAFHAVNQSQYKESTHGLFGTEKSLRFLAGEDRFMRRILSQGLSDIILKTEYNKRMIRIIPSKQMDGLYYLFLLFPSHLAKSESEYRGAREYFLRASCMVARLINPEIKHIVGLATETGIDFNKSEDLLYFNCDDWSQEIEEQAKKDQINLGILINPLRFETNEIEYPKINKTRSTKVHRNDPCPCGSGLKYKKCHGNKEVNV